MPIPPEDITDYLLDELPPERRAEIDALLRSDPAARDEFERQGALLSALRALPAEEPPRRTVFVSAPPAKSPASAPGRSGTSPWLRTAGLAAAAALVVMAGVWASGLVPPAPTQWTEQHLREVVREEAARTEARWQSELDALARSAASREAVETELASLRKELAEISEDAAAGYEFVNAKHELLRRQLLEFDVASAAEVLP